MIAPLLHGEALEQYEAFAIEEFAAYGLKVSRETGKLEVVLNALSPFVVTIMLMERDL